MSSDVKSAAIMDLVAGYETYSNAQELNAATAADAPATSAPCISAASAISWYTSLAISKTIDNGC